MNVRAIVETGAKKEKLTELLNGTFEIAVRERAEHNMANWRVRKMLAERFKTTLTKVKILTGHKSPKKCFEISV